MPCNFNSVFDKALAFTQRSVLGNILSSPVGIAIIVVILVVIILFTQIPIQSGTSSAVVFRALLYTFIITWLSMKIHSGMLAQKYKSTRAERANEQVVGAVSDGMSGGTEISPMVAPVLASSRLPNISAPVSNLTPVSNPAPKPISATMSNDEILAGLDLNF